MNTFTVALALAAIGAEASYHRGGYSAHGRPAYSQGTQGQHVHAQYYNPHAAPAAEEPFVQPHVSTHRYGSHANKTQYDRRYPDAHGNYNHGGLLPKYESPHSHLAHRHTETRDPWGDVQGEVTEDREGWWSPHRQFSPPLVRYVPAELKSTVYAVCNLTVAEDTDPSTTGYVQIAQDPHRPSSIRADITYSSAIWPPTDGEVKFDVYTTGDIKNSDGVFDCDFTGYSDDETAALGDIFHPLEEKRNGVVNPYADPARGQIANKPYDGVNGISLDDVQTDLLMDLAGPNSLIGRALYVLEIQISDGSAQQLLGCCVIARATGPDATPAPAKEVWQQSIHTQYHAADPQHEQHTHDAPTYGSDYGNSPAPQSGYKSYGHGSYNRYPQKSHSHHGAWY